MTAFVGRFYLDESLVQRSQSGNFGLKGPRMPSILREQLSLECCMTSVLLAVPITSVRITSCLGLGLLAAWMGKSL